MCDPKSSLTKYLVVCSLASTKCQCFKEWLPRLWRSWMYQERCGVLVCNEAVARPVFEILSRQVAVNLAMHLLLLLELIFEIHPMLAFMSVVAQVEGSIESN